MLINPFLGTYEIKRKLIGLSCWGIGAHKYEQSLQIIGCYLHKSISKLLFLVFETKCELQQITYI